MARDDPQLKLRLPQALKERVEAQAARNGRSINAEIVHRLGGASVTEAPAADFLRQEADELAAQISGHRWELEQAHRRLGEVSTALMEGREPISDDKIKLLQMDARFYRSKLDETESRLRRINRILGENNG